MSTEPIQIAYGVEALQFGHLYLPDKDGPHPVALLIHGGFWRARYDLSLMHGLAQDLAQRGVAAWNIEYRRVGDTGGGWPGTLLDVAMAADYLHTLHLTYQLDMQRVITVGHSAGGHLALWLATRPRLPKDNPLTYTTTPLLLKGVVSLAGVADLRQAWALDLGSGATAALLGGPPQALPERYASASPAELLPLHIPQVLIHGDHDDRVPIVVSRDYAKKAIAAGDPVTLLELPGANHFILIDPHSEAWHICVEQIQRLLAPVV
jgi:acetyl esterase/lipase